MNKSQIKQRAVLAHVHDIFIFSHFCYLRNQAGIFSSCFILQGVSASIHPSSTFVVVHLFYMNNIYVHIFIYYQMTTECHALLCLLVSTSSHFNSIILNRGYLWHLQMEVKELTSQKYNVFKDLFLFERAELERERERPLICWFTL